MSRLAADFDADGQVTLRDVLMLLKYYLGKSETVQPQWCWREQQYANDNVSKSINSIEHKFFEGTDIVLIGLLKGDVDFSWSN